VAVDADGGRPGRRRASGDLAIEVGVVDGPAEAMALLGRLADAAARAAR